MVLFGDVGEVEEVREGAGHRQAEFDRHRGEFARQLRELRRAAAARVLRQRAQVFDHAQQLRGPPAPPACRRAACRGGGCPAAAVDGDRRSRRYDSAAGLAVERAIVSWPACGSTGGGGGTSPPFRNSSTLRSSSITAREVGLYFSITAKSSAVSVGSRRMKCTSCQLGLLALRRAGAPARHAGEHDAVLDEIEQLAVAQLLRARQPHVRRLRIEVAAHLGVAAAVVGMAARAVIGVSARARRRSSPRWRRPDSSGPCRSTASSSCASTTRRAFRAPTASGRALTPRPCSNSIRIRRPTSGRNRNAAVCVRKPFHFGKRGRGRPHVQAAAVGGLGPRKYHFAVGDRGARVAARARAGDAGDR